jgi:hypothetical protein
MVILCSLIATFAWKADALAGPPDLSNVSDILQGDRYLLRDDDLLFLQTTVGNANFQALQLLVPSANSNFSTPVSSSNASVINAPFTPSSAVAFGRFYNSINDDVLTVGQQFSNGSFVWTASVRDPKTVTTSTATIPSGFEPAFGATAMQIVKGDFNGDGFEDAAVVYAEESLSPLPFGINIVTASNAQTNDSPIAIGPAYTNLGGPLTPIVGTLVAGDFTGQGVYGMAALMNDNQTIQLYSVNPQTLQISLGQSVQLPFALGPVGNVALVAGRFNDPSHDELVVVGQLMGEKKLEVVSIAIDRSTLVPTVAQSARIDVNVGSVIFPISNMIAKAAPLSGMFGVQDQLIIGYSSLLFGGIIDIGSFGPNFNYHRKSRSQVSTTEPTCLYSLEAGNFDNRNSSGQRIPDYELAALYMQGNNNENFSCPGVSSGSQQLMAEIFQLDTAKPSWLVSPNQTTLVDFPNGLDGLTGAQMVIGDAQGRSLRLGAPDKVVIEGQLQPDIVLGIPPMHVDYIRPNFVFNPATHPGCQDPNRPCNLNLTVRPSVPAPSTGFATQFNFTSSSSTSSNRRTTTSFGLAIKGSNETKVTYGIPFVGSVSADLKASVQHTHDTRVSTSFDTYQTKSNSLTATTGFADHVFFSQSRQNIYYYPVLGQMTCPSTIPNCTADQMTPLYVAFSAPDRVTQSDLDATTLDWYQGSHEPGNVLSYPWDSNQLQAQFSESLMPQTTNPAPCRGTDTSKVAYSTTWGQGSQSSKSSGSTNALSADVSLSVSGSAFGVTDQASVGVDYSSSLSTFQQSTQTLSSSEGVTVLKPAFGSDVAACCLYDFGSYLFGLGNPNGTFQNFNLMTPSNKPVDVQTTGPLIVGFVSNPIPNQNDQLSCGGQPAWWQQVYNLPDVAMIHPERWDWSKEEKTATFNLAQPGVSPLVQPFYHARGFFITEQNGTGGSSISEARQGDQLTLAARIYNLSLVDTDDPTLSDPAASIHVRFYGQLYNQGNLDGNSFLIGETTLVNIPAFKSTLHTGQNWRDALVSFDTSPYGGNQYMVFWVVTWMEDANGNLVPEMPDHGLSTDPSNLSFNQITDVPTQAHSNNVGMYPVDSPFFIADKNSPPGISTGGATLSIPDMAIENGGATRDRRGVLDLDLHATSAAASRVTVTLTLRGPKGRRQLIGLQQIPYVPADGDYQMHAIFRPKVCGRTTIIVSAVTESGESTTTKMSAHIACKLRPIAPPN